MPSLHERDDRDSFRHLHKVREEFGLLAMTKHGTEGRWECVDKLAEKMNCGRVARVLEKEYFRLWATMYDKQN
jgi:hypothetical protein